MKDRYGVNEWYDMMNEGVHREVALGPKEGLKEVRLEDGTLIFTED